MHPDSDFYTTRSRDRGTNACNAREKDLAVEELSALSRALYAAVVAEGPAVERKTNPPECNCLRHRHLHNLGQSRVLSKNYGKPLKRCIDVARRRNGERQNSHVAYTLVVTVCVRAQAPRIVRVRVYVRMGGRETEMDDER